ncbi:GntR family transcriptional regulator [Paracoccus sp. (in: a-proteobacteria)]|uniref:GntR family transcriptional regulator n=1 Tax=Paracoccus sp. TaxID=267 RepID=UPI00396C899C
MIIQTGGTDIVEDLRGRILALELPPGSALSRVDLGARYGISSTPLRDALLRLQEEGLVVIHPQARTSVSLIDLNHARQVHFMRSAVETEVVRKLALNPPDDLGLELEHLLAAQEERAERGDLTGFSRLDLAFHHALFRHAGLEAIHRVIRRESGHIDRLRALHLMQPAKVRQILSDHQAVMHAIMARTPDEAADRMQDHLSQSILLGKQLTSLRPDYFAELPD